MGLLAIDVPEEYGGLELDKATNALVIETISCDIGFSGAFTTHTGIATIPLVYYGTKAQKEKYLGRIITGELITAYCLTETESGSDALGAKTSAVLSADGRYYVLNGTKQFITNGGIADIFRAESIVYRVAGLLDRRLASIEKETPNYYGVYQKGIEEYSAECAIAKVYCSEAVGGSPTRPPDPWRIRLHADVPRGAVLPGREAQPVRRGDERDQPAPHLRHPPQTGDDGGNRSIAQGDEGRRNR